MLNSRHWCWCDTGARIRIYVNILFPCGAPLLIILLQVDKKICVLWLVQQKICRYNMSAPNKIVAWSNSKRCVPFSRLELCVSAHLLRTPRNAMIQFCGGMIPQSRHLLLRWGNLPVYAGLQCEWHPIGLLSTNCMMTITTFFSKAVDKRWLKNELHQRTSAPWRRFLVSKWSPSLSSSHNWEMLLLYPRKYL